MPEEWPPNNDLTTLVPRGLLRRIKAHFDEGVEEAVKKYRFHAEDEDALTGALAQALSTPEHIVSVLGGSRYSFAVESYKILGKGPGTPEKRMGADGIFQVSVREGDKQIFEKGLPFQAKRKDRYRPGEVLGQAKDLFRTAETGVILRYGPDGYDAADVRHLLHHDALVPFPTPPGFSALGTVLGDWFLQCHIGRVGLSFDKDEPDPNDLSKRGTWVISTRIRKTKTDQPNGPLA